MRNMVSDQTASSEPARTANDAARPELVQRATLAANCKIILVAVFAAMPFALWALDGGNYVPFVVAIAALGAAISSLTMLRQGNAQFALLIQVMGLTGAGLMLTIAENGLVDFGLATALLAPVLASVLGDKKSERLSWIMTVLVVTCAALSSTMLTGFGGLDAQPVSWAAAATYAVSALLVAYSAHQLGTSAEGFQKAQLDTFRHLVEHLQNVVLRFSAEGDLSFISRTAEDLFDCQRYELAGSGLLDRIHIQDRPLYLTAFADANRAGHSRTIEVRMRKDDASGNATGIPGFVWVEVSLSPVVEGMVLTGMRHEVIALLRDISRRKAQEKEMQEARKTAEEASYAKTHFLATVGHELRTPLNAIVGFSEMMSSEIVGKLEDGQREYAGLIHKSGMHLLDIVNMLLDMSKIEAGKFELQVEEFDAEDLAAPCINIVEGMAAERNIRLNCDMPTPLPQIKGDERAYRQILINLMSNAIKFSPDCGEVTFSMRRQGHCLNMSVTDHGIGMDSATVARLGEPFFQAQRGFARKYEGTGLGISIVKGLVDLHDGKLNIQSTPDKGTIVTVLMPISGPQPAQVPAPVVTQLPTKKEDTPTPQWPHQKSIAR